MGTITDINSKALADLKNILQADLVLTTNLSIPHAEGEHMIVGEKYEMFAPAAEQAAANLGIAWHDDEGYSFTYAGTLSMQGELYLCTKDIHYAGDVVPAVVQAQFDALRGILNGVMPLCPTYIASKLIRPATDG